MITALFAVVRCSNTVGCSASVHANALFSLVLLVARSKIGRMVLFFNSAGLANDDAQPALLVGMRLIRPRKLLLFISIFGGALSGCNKVNQNGQLLVNFIESGTYEIYKIASESPLQFVSEQAGQFNARVQLSPGSYLVLADCSSQVVNIYPNSVAELTAHKINFIPMQPPAVQDKFSVQCLRSERTRSRQQINNRFSLSVLSGVRDILVGMVPLQVNLDTKPGEPSHLVTYVLSSISVARPKNLSGDEGFGYFLTPVSEMAPYTENQKDNAKLYVLKGQYEIQLNGTSMTVDLAEGEGRLVIPASLRVEVSPITQLDMAAKIKGTPLYVEANGEHYLHLNTSYAVLPGKIGIRLSTTLKATEILAKEAEIIKIRAKNVTVSLGCSAEDWQCLGSRKVRLFEKGKSYPFVESVTDVPVLYFGDNISVGIEGSRNIKYELSAGDDQKLRVGYIEVTPTPTHKAGVLTDLVRVEPSQSQIYGASLDLPLDKLSVLPLVAGNYHLAQYAFFTGDGSRRKTTTSVNVSYGERVKIAIATYLSEKRMSVIDPSFVSSEEKAKVAQ